MTLLAGQILANKLEILEQISSGGFGTLYRARQLSFDRIVAVKVLTERPNPEINKRFQREAKSLSHIDHPNVVRVLEHGTLDDGRPYLVMQYIEGINLHDLLQSKGALSPDQTLVLYTQLASALKASHDADVLHRDLKPGNIIVSHDLTHATLVDFGLVRPTGSWSQNTVQLTNVGMTVGSVCYMSPEQCFGKELDVTSDIYSLACVMYQALTGKPPFAGQTDMEIMSSHVNLPAARLSIDTDGPARNLPSIIARSLQKDPKHRYPTAATLRDALQSDLDLLPEPDKIASKPNSAPATTKRIHATKMNPARTAVVPVVAITVVLIAAAAAAIYVFSLGTSPKTLVTARGNIWYLNKEAGQVVIHDASTDRLYQLDITEQSDVSDVSDREEYSPLGLLATAEFHGESANSSHGGLESIRLVKDVTPESMAHTTVAEFLYKIRSHQDLELAKAQSMTDSIQFNEISTTFARLIEPTYSRPLYLRAGSERIVKDDASGVVIDIYSQFYVPQEPPRIWRFTVNPKRISRDGYHPTITAIETLEDAPNSSAAPSGND